MPVPDPTPLLSVENLVKTFGTGSRERVQAVSDVSFTLGRGETLGIVGETGSGKSTLVRTILGVTTATNGRVVLDGEDLSRLRGGRQRAARRSAQMIFQDAMSSLDSRWPVEKSLDEPLRLQTSLSRSQRRARVAELLELVGLDPTIHGSRYPRQLSGGQAQRVAIARAIALRPKLVVCDEPVSALDVSVQAQIINLLERLRRELGLSYIFVSHDLSVVRHISDRVAVMYLGKFCEIGDAEQVFRAPRHPYTQVLLDAVPGRTPAAPMRMHGELPSPSNPPSGCRFRTRCPLAQERCAAEAPSMRGAEESDHLAACHFPLRLGGASPGEKQKVVA
ncbi:dipeptide ABC transporter ATP-binding protein [Microbacterium kribbense]|uniref:Dipeptide ABC transporter ATP-binding protein n=1 Tax=Microbacterium kribbense TaxID=433645 RepID=A0ABP7GMT4_9MICO